MDNEKKTVEMSAAEMEQFAAFKEAQAKKEAEAKKKADREAYAKLVDETIAASMPELEDISKAIADRKRKVMGCFNDALKLKAEIFGVKDNQHSHTFTNSEGTARITLGQYQLDNYKDTVSEGIAIVKEYLNSLAKDDDSAALVQAVLRLMSRDNAGNLKASRVLQLRKMAQDSGNERFMEGVRIIEESYAPTDSKQFIRAEVKDENGKWVAVPLGMTEC